MRIKLKSPISVQTSEGEFSVKFGGCIIICYTNNRFYRELSVFGFGFYLEKGCIINGVLTSEKSHENEAKNSVCNTRQ